MNNFSFTKIIFLSFVILLASTLAFAQKPTPTPPEDDNVVKISTTLIQLDVVVTDKKGNQVTDLKPEDFEVYENGKKQDITNFSFISVDSKGKSETYDSPSAGKNKNSVPIPPIKLKPEQVRRTYALVVDDLGLSFANIYWVQQALKKFINEQMQEGDLVAIVRTGIGIGALQSFSSDKRQLLAAIDKIKWNSYGRVGINTFEPIKPDFKDEIGITSQSGKAVQGADTDKSAEKQIEDFRNSNFSVGTLGALKYIVNGMGELPGRKAVVLFSEGFSFTSNGVPNRVSDAMRVLADLANRSSVVFYTLDPRGLQAPGMATAADDIREILPDGYDPGKAVDPRDSRVANFEESQQSLRFLAYETGGIPYVNQNNLNAGLQRVINDQGSYYLLGYQPNEETFDPKKNKYNKLEVKLTRPDLKIRYRSGFFGITDTKIKQIAQTPKQQLAAALVSPFGASELSINLYSIFYNDAQDRSSIRSFMYINPNELTFTPGADGLYQTTFDVIAAVFNSNGESANNNITSQTLKFTKEQLARVQRNGIIYNLPVPIIKPDAYQFRIALQDTATGKIGAASQFIEIPDLSKKKLTLSNLVVKQYSLDEWKKVSLAPNDDLTQPTIVLCWTRLSANSNAERFSLTHLSFTTPKPLPDKNRTSDAGSPFSRRKNNCRRNSFPDQQQRPEKFVAH